MRKLSLAEIPSESSSLQPLRPDLRFRPPTLDSIGQKNAAPLFLPVFGPYLDTIRPYCTMLLSKDETWQWCFEVLLKRHMGCTVQAHMLTAHMLTACNDAAILRRLDAAPFVCIEFVLAVRWSGSELRVPNE